MFDTLSEGFKQAGLKLQGKTQLSEDNIKEAIAEIRTSLLEGDVEYGVAKTFLKRVEDEAIGKIVQTKAGKGHKKKAVGAREHFISICQKELEHLMGPVSTDLNFVSNRPTVVMMVGLQGTGKTTTTAKLAKFLTETKKKKPLLVAADIYRPAAVDQLKTLGERINTPVFHVPDTKPQAICEQAIQKAFELNCDTVLLDTAGRLTIDAELMQELVDIKTKVKPDNILLVCDAMMGQDAVTTAKSFNETLDLSGFIMTKLDGDARGGAALSIKEVTKKPIKFLGIGEALENLEEFRPEGLASRILGKGDVVGLMQDFDRVAEEDAEEKAMQMLKGQFTFEDFYKQISMIQKMGSLKDIVAKMPMQNMLQGADFDDKQLIRIKAMIDSMTKKERVKPDIIDDSRANRIAKGSGRSINELKDLIKKFKAMKSMMGSLGKNLGMLGKIPGMGGLSKMKGLKDMAAQMAGGGMPNIPGMDMFGGMGSARATKKAVDRDKLKKLRKQARKTKKRNRKK